MKLLVGSLLTSVALGVTASPLNENEGGQLVQFNDGNVLVYKCAPGATGLVELVFVDNEKKAIYPVVIRCGVST